MSIFKMEEEKNKGVNTPGVEKPGDDDAVKEKELDDKVKAATGKFTEFAKNHPDFEEYWEKNWKAKVDEHIKNAKTLLEQQLLEEQIQRGIEELRKQAIIDYFTTQGKDKLTPEEQKTFENLREENKKVSEEQGKAATKKAEEKLEEIPGDQSSKDEAKGFLKNIRESGRYKGDMAFWLADFIHGKEEAVNILKGTWSNEKTIGLIALALFPFGGGVFVVLFLYALSSYRKQKEEELKAKKQAETAKKAAKAEEAQKTEKSEEKKNDTPVVPPVLSIPEQPQPTAKDTLNQSKPEDQQTVPLATESNTVKMPMEMPSTPPSQPETQESSSIDTDEQKPQGGSTVA